MSKSIPSAGQPGADRGRDQATGLKSLDTEGMQRIDAIAGYFCDIASQMGCLVELLSAEVGGGASDELAARLVAATALAQRVGYMADMAADNLGSGVAIGDAERWFLAPESAKALPKFKEATAAVYPGYGAAGAAQ